MDVRPPTKEEQEALATKVRDALFSRPPGISRYMPHQGKREIQRRLRQQAGRNTKEPRNG